MSLDTAVGVGPTIELGGETLTITPRLVRHFGEMEAEIKKERGNPFDAIREASEALKDTDPALLKEIVSNAFMEARNWKYVSMDDIFEWMSNTWRGQRFVIWLTVRDNDREKWTFDHFSQVFSDEFEERYHRDGALAAQKWVSQIEAAISQASGEDELGNSTGSPQSTPEEDPTE